MIKYIGIDLGHKGSLSIQSKLAFHKPTLSIFPFWHRHSGTKCRSATIEELIELFKSEILSSGESYIAIEHPVFMPKNGKKAIASMFYNYGVALGLCKAFDLTGIWTPTPREWKAITKTPGSDKSKLTVHRNQSW